MAVIVTPTTRSFAPAATAPCGVAGHRSNAASALGLVLRFAIAGVLVAVGINVVSSVATFLLGWTLVSFAAAIAWSTFVRHAEHLRGGCADCDDDFAALAARAARA